MLERAANTVIRGFEILIVICLSVMGILVLGNVVLRYGFDSGIAISVELARLLFVWLIFLGAVLASARGIHIGFDTLQQAFGARTRRVLQFVIGVLVLITAVIFIIGGWKQTVINMGNTFPVMGISYGWLYGVAIVFGVALLFPACRDIWHACTGQLHCTQQDAIEGDGQ